MGVMPANASSQVTPAGRASAYACLEGHNTALTRQQPSANFPAQNHRAGLVWLHRQDRIPIGMRTARNVLESPDQAVGHGHVGDGLAAQVAVLQVERHYVAD